MKARDDLALARGYHSPQVDVEVRLNVNESPYPPPEAWRRAFLDELATIEFNRYPDRSAAELRAALAAHHGVAPDNVFAANGSNEVLQTLCLAYGGAGRSAAVFEPTYALHSHIARITGTAVVTGERDADFALDLGEVDRVLSEAQPALVFLCSPNNPTAGADSTEVVDEVLRRAPGMVVVDEAYGQFSRHSAADRVADGSNLVVTRTFSKTWSLAALRLGYCLAPAEVVAELDKLALPYHLDVAQQVAGRLALRYQAEMEARVAALVEERGRLVALLGDLAVDTWPSEANFVLFRPRPRSGDAVWRGLLERSVLVRNCASWPRLADCLRVTVGTASENDAFIAALTEALA